MGGAQGAVSLGVVTAVLQSAVVPVDGDGVGATDAGLLDAQVVTTATGERRRAALAAVGEGVGDNHGAVSLVLVGRRVGGLDVQVGSRDGLGHGDERAQLEQRELHDEKLKRRRRVERMRMRKRVFKSTKCSCNNWRRVDQWETEAKRREKKR